MNTIKTVLMMILASAISVNAANVVCIGINDYTSYPDLKHAENDANEVARMFTAMGHSVTVLSGVQATCTNVAAALEGKPAFVYFAGHAETRRLMLQDGEMELSAIADADTMMLLDCCYIGRGLKQSGTMKILAAAEYEAFESGNHGLFTKYLLDWMGRGKDLAETSLTAFLEKHIRAETGGWQKPVLGFI